MAAGLKQKMLQAELQRVERELNEILPLVNEANLAGQELGRQINFSTKIVKKLDPFLNKEGGMSQGKTEIMIKVDNKEDGYYYEWPADKFRNRMFVIRDILDDYFDSGEKPHLDHDTDPFWDPPNPILIGQSFIQLEPLGLQFENFLDATILSIDGQGGSQGFLTVGYAPCTIDGITDEEELPEDLMVDDVDELVGKENLYFKVYVKHASNIPQNLCSNPFVTYQFKFDKEIYRVPQINGQASNPEWKYEKQHTIGFIDKELARELKNGCISFQVYGYPPSAGNQLAKGTQDGGAKLKRMMTKKKGIADHEAEAKALDLKDQDVYVPEIKQKAPAASSEAKAESKMKRAGTLKAKGVETKSAADAGIDKTQFETPQDNASKGAGVTKAAVVG
jgi:hypothetical protein